MIDIFAAFFKRLKEDTSLTDLESLHSIVGPRFLEPSMILQINPTQVDVTKDLPKIVYYGSNESAYLDKNEMLLVVSAYAKKYNDCVAICNRISNLIYDPYNRPGTSSPTLKPKDSIISVITKTDNESDAYNSTYEVYERTIRFNIKYVKRC